jgi:hypothetical protein
MASQSHRICVADSSSCRHISQVGSSVSPSLKRCHLRWQCPVSSPTTHLSWSLFSSNRSFVRLAEVPDINPFACLSRVVDSEYFLWFLCRGILLIEQYFQVMAMRLAYAWLLASAVSTRTASLSTSAIWKQTEPSEVLCERPCAPLIGKTVTDV